MTEHVNRKNRTLRWSILEEKQKSNAENPCANTHGFLWDILFGHLFATSRCPVAYGKSQMLLKWYSSTLATGFRFSPTSLRFQRSRAWLCLLVFSCRINIDSGLVQTPLHSCAEPNWRIKYEERCLNQIGAAVLEWCGKSFKFDRVCRTFVEPIINLGSTQCAPSESDVAPVSLQSRTYSIRFDTWKVRRLNQASVTPSTWAR